MAKVWDKGKGAKLDPLVEAYEVGVDYQLDGRLFKYELAASMAHAKMLAQIGVLSADELQKLQSEIQALYRKHGEAIELSISDEDIHSKLEALLTDKLGTTGKKIHTGRSRNDQALVVTRLYEKESLIRIALAYADLLNAFIRFAEREGDKILPGYTHTKQAMLVTVKFWVTAFIESGLDNLRHLGNLFDLIDQNPLGTASGFGAPLALDRKMTTRLLGFSRTQGNPQYAQNSRGKFEGLLVDGLWAIMQDFSRMARDLLMFNMDEFLYLETDDAITTGSSIMPQKKNFDVMELVRARANLMLSYSNALKTMSTGLISGYHRDLQESKEPLMKSIRLAEDSIRVIEVVFGHIRFDEDAVKSALTPGIFATDIAFKAVAEGKPFRDAYREAAEKIESIKVDDATIQHSIKERVSPGSPATIKPDDYRDKLSALSDEWQAKKKSMAAVFSELLE